jgi:hypothetical protein
VVFHKQKEEKNTGKKNEDAKRELRETGRGGAERIGSGDGEVCGQGMKKKEDESDEQLSVV